jgi:hypothetical protein
MNRLKELRAEYAQMQAEFEDVTAMDEEVACHNYNVNSKEEIIQSFIEWLNDLAEQIDACEDDDEEPVGRKPYHFAFATQGDFWRWKGF